MKPKPVILVLSIGVIFVLGMGELLLLGAWRFVQYRTFQCPGHFACPVDPGIPIGRTLMAIGIAFALIAWLLSLIATARIRRWGWLAVVFLFNVVGALLYGIFGPTRPAQHIAQ